MNRGPLLSCSRLNSEPPIDNSVAELLWIHIDATLKISTALLELTHLNGAVDTCEGAMLGLEVVISRPNRIRDRYSLHWDT